MIDRVVWNFGEVAGDDEENLVGPLFADFKAARISKNSDVHAVIRFSGEAHWIIFAFIGVAGDDLTLDGR